MIVINFNTDKTHPLLELDESVRAAFPLTERQRDEMRNKLKNNPNGTSLLASINHMLIRTGKEATHGSSSAPVHQCSVKIYLSKSSGSDGDFELDIPTKPFNSPSAEKANTKLKKFSESRKSPLKNKLDPAFRDAVVNFIYDNQMALIALWYCENSRQQEFLENYIKRKLIDVDYVKGKFGPKSERQLLDDRRMLKDLMWTDPKGPDGELNFGK